MDPEEQADHGTVKRFGQGCECEPCCQAARPWQERWNAVERHRPTDWLSAEERKRRVSEQRTKGRLRRIAAAAAGLIDVPHGTPSGRFDYGCGCEPCMTAARAYRRATYLRRRTG